MCCMLHLGIEMARLRWIARVDGSRDGSLIAGAGTYEDYAALGRYSLDL